VTTLLSGCGGGLTLGRTILDGLGLFQLESLLDGLGNSFACLLDFSDPKNVLIALNVRVDIYWKSSLSIVPERPGSRPGLW